MEQQIKKTLNPQTAWDLVERHRKTIAVDSGYDLTDFKEFDKHCSLIEMIGSNYMSREFGEFVVDERNRNILKFLVYYFNGCSKCEEIFPEENYKVHKNLLLVGDPGTGKTLIMQIFSDYLRLMHNPNQFYNLSVTEMMNYYKINGHIDKFTYNESGTMEGNPFNICLNDVGLETENQKSYGTSLDSVIDEFLYARYEIYQLHFKRYHITSNLNVNEFDKRFGDRLIDRFKSFNLLPVCGESRRK